MSTALVESKAPEVTPSQLETVKKTVANGATAEELKLYLYDCARQGIHPLDRLIHFTKQSGKYTPITSIDFMRMRAEATGEYCGNDDPVFEGEDEELIAHVTVWRMIQGQRCPFTATSRWSEYCPAENKAFMWKKMPYLMLSKCAEALALRKGFPRQLHGLYAAEEMDQASRPAPEPMPKNGKKFTPQELTDAITARVLLLNTVEDCEDSIKKVKAREVGADNFQKIMAVINERKAQLAAADLADAPWEVEDKREPRQEG